MEHTVQRLCNISLGDLHSSTNQSPDLALKVDLVERLATLCKGLDQLTFRGPS